MHLVLMNFPSRVRSYSKVAFLDHAKSIKQSTVECRDHRLAAIETVSLQISKLELEELIECLALREEFVNALLLSSSWKGWRTATTTATAAARLQNV